MQRLSGARAQRLRAMLPCLVSPPYRGEDSSLCSRPSFRLLLNSADGPCAAAEEDPGRPGRADHCHLRASCLQNLSGSSLRNSTPGDTSLLRPRKPERRRADEPMRQPVRRQHRKYSDNI